MISVVMVMLSMLMVGSGGIDEVLQLGFGDDGNDGGSDSTGGKDDCGVVFMMMDMRLMMADFVFANIK